MSRLFVAFGVLYAPLFRLFHEPKDPLAAAVERLFGEPAALYGFGYPSVRVFFGGHREVGPRLYRADAVVSSAPVAYNEPLEAPLAAQDFVYVIAVSGRIGAVYLVV